MTQNEQVVQVIASQGGMATLEDIYRLLLAADAAHWRTKTPQASIRRIVRTTPAIYTIRRGLYGLRSFEQANEANGFVQETAENVDSPAVQAFTHSYYQGLLLRIGVLRGYQTYLPKLDRNRAFDNKTILWTLATTGDLPPFSYTEFVARARTVDAVWLAPILGLELLQSLFELEHTTDMQNALVKFEDLSGFNTRMVIVAPQRRRHEYEAKLHREAFKRIHQRVAFLSYEDLGRQYEYELERQSYSFKL